VKLATTIQALTKRQNDFGAKLLKASKQDAILEEYFSIRALCLMTKKIVPR
jgi:hypothetical protein